MKYGILTYHNIPNFGALLQAYSFCATLRELGTDCDILDYQCENIVQRELTFHPSANPIKTVAHRLLVWPFQRKKIHACQQFIKPYCSKNQYTRANVQKANNVYDGFIAGSDMIWNREVNGCDQTFFLDFTAHDKYRFSYASSIGGIWSEEDWTVISSLLGRFNRLSVREEDTAKMIRKQLNLSCESVCDPTMLMLPAVWDKLTVPVYEKNYIVVYFPYPEILAAAKRYASEHAQKVLVLGVGMLPHKGMLLKQVYTPEEWISYIKNANAVFTDSYHGLLFSLYFRRPVWTNNRSNRTISLLKQLGQEQCWIDEDPHFAHVIDYQKVQAALLEMRKKSLDYLKTALKNEGENHAY